MSMRRHTHGAGHPSYNCYRYHKCRCAGCRAAQYTVRQRYYARLRAERQYPVPHTLARLYREVLGIDIRDVAGA